MTVKRENIQATIDVMKFNESIRLNMDTWIDEESGSYTDKHWCGTTCCLAGYAAVAAHGLESAMRSEGNISQVAREYLGITDSQAAHLFYPPKTAAWHIDNGDGIKLLEHLRDTGEVDWGIIDPEFAKEDED